MGVSAGRARTRWASFFLCCLVAVSFWGFITPTWQTVRAQEPGAAPAAEAPKEAPPPARSGENSIFLHIIKSVGWMWPVILILSVSLVFLIVLLTMDLRMGDAVPPAFVEEFTDTVNKRQFKQAFDLARADNSYLAKVRSNGLAPLQYAIEDAREAAMNTVESIKASKEQLITYLATIGTLGPLFGLVGTVYLMIGALMKMADVS